MILISDAHVNVAHGTHRPFFEMLKRLRKNSEDIVFMGDIFDLWIALPRYEAPVHADFLGWCNAQKARRDIGYIEGNHEFFLAEEKGDAFSWATDRPFRSDGKGTLFCHGDRINRQDTAYLRFRRLTKNRIVKRLLRCVPAGPFWVDQIKKKLRHTNQAFRGGLPEDALRDTLLCARACGMKRVFVAHFHQEAFFYQKDTQLHVLPDWQRTRKVTRFDPHTGEVCHLPWQNL